MKQKNGSRTMTIRAAAAASLCVAASMALWMARGARTAHADGDFATQRAELLAVLEPLPPEGWSRAATVTGAGKPLERTVLFYAQWLARHERPHIKQVERIVNTLRR